MESFELPDSCSVIQKLENPAYLSHLNRQANSDHKIRSQLIWFSSLTTLPGREKGSEKGDRQGLKQCAGKKSTTLVCVMEKGQGKAVR